MIDVLFAGILSVMTTAQHKVAPTGVCPGPVSPAVYATVDIFNAGNNSVESHGAAWSSDCWGSREGGVQGIHSIDAWDSDCLSCLPYRECYANYWTDQNEYSGTINDAVECDFTYWGDINVVSAAYGGLYPLYNRFQSGTIQINAACDTNHDPIIIYEDSDCPQYQNCHSPVVLNLGSGKYEFSGKNDPVLFDIDATGEPIRIAWTAAGAPMAFLAFDRNNNGRIDDGSELFGNHTPLPDGGTARNGFAALVPYDANHDGVIDENDPIWSSLVLWTDLNHDGISQASELLPVNQSNVAAIGLDYHWTGRRDPSGNHFRYGSRVWMNHAPRATPRPVYDIFFVAVP